MEKTTNRKSSAMINVKSFVTATVIIFVLMVVSFVLAKVLPGGAYERVLDKNGNLVIKIENGSAIFNEIEGGLPFWKWILSPFLVLGADGGFTIIAVIIFLLVIGGVFAGLEKCGLTKYMLSKITAKFGKSKYKLMAIIILFFMALGTAVGSFEECVPLVPIVVALSVALGWDVLTGVTMSILAAGCGFAAGICNPFTVGVAETLVGESIFAGVWLRIVAFVLIYGLLYAFTYRHAKKIEKPIDLDSLRNTFVSDKKLDKATICFVVILGVGILSIIVFGLVPALRDFTMIVVALVFLVLGIVCPIVAGLNGKEHAVSFGRGVLGVVPAVLMILMASSIRYTLTEANVMDTILHAMEGVFNNLPRWSIILFVYLFVLILNFAIPSGSAKAVMLIPLITALGSMFGVSAQLCILAFAFGDGFSNMFYPTNPVLLISLGLSDVGYGKWVKHTWKFQLVNLLLTSGILLFGYAIGF